MLLFSGRERKRKDAQSFLTKIINNQCPTMTAAGTDERGDRRVNLSLPVYVVPVRDGYPDMTMTFATVTKELSTSGMSLITTEKLEVPQVIVALWWDETVTLFRGDIRHQNHLGAGLRQCGVQVQEIVPAGEYRQLNELSFAE